MFTNRSDGGENNLCGRKLAEMRKGRGLSQRAMADALQLIGLDLDKNAIQRIEAGKRFVTDIELAAFSRFFQVSCDVLLGL